MTIICVSLMLIYSKLSTNMSCGSCFFYNVYLCVKPFNFVCFLGLLLDSVGQNDEADEDADGAVQKPDAGLVFEHLSADQDGETHHSSNQRVKP